MPALPVPSQTIRTEIKAFCDDRSTALTEASMTALIAAFPRNRKVSHVMLKVVALNRLYRTRILDKEMEDLAEHITSISSLDRMLAAGSPEAVPAIYSCPKTREFYSFATKFCSWHNQKAYSIWDGNVDEALWAYRNERKPAFNFKRRSLKTYTEFLGVVQAFRTHFGLTAYSLKQVDMFLWQVGGRLLQ